MALDSIEKNITTLRDQNSLLEKTVEQSNGLLTENIISHRGHLLSLIGGLIAFIGFFQENIISKPNISIKITIVCFLMTIIFGLLVAIVYPVYDIKLIEYKKKLTQAYQKKVEYHEDKIKNLQSNDQDITIYNQETEKYKELMDTGFGQKLAYYLAGVFTFIYCGSLIVGIISLIVYYITIITQ